MRRTSKPGAKKKNYLSNKDYDISRVAAVIPTDYVNIIKASNVSINSAINSALHMYFKDHYRNKLETALFALYEVMFDLEKLQEKGQIGFTKFSEAHSLQLDSYKEAIRILENSPLFLPPDDPE